MVGYDTEDPLTAAAYGNIPKTFTAFLDNNGLKGARLGILREAIGRGDPNSDDFKKVEAVFNKSLEELKAGRLVRWWIEAAQKWLGFPPSGHEYWNEETLAAVKLRYPNLDVAPYQRRFPHPGPKVASSHSANVEMRLHTAGKTFSVLQSGADAIKVDKSLSIPAGPAVLETIVDGRVHRRNIRVISESTTTGWLAIQ